MPVFKRYNISILTENLINTKMKKRIQKTDAWMQVVLFACWVFSLLVRSEYFFDFYFIIGGWQLVSLLFYWVSKASNYDEKQNIFRLIIIFFLILIITGLLYHPLLGLILLMLFFCSPVLFICYTYTCFLEINYLKRRPLYQLK